MAVENKRIVGTAHASANLRINSAGVGNLRMFFTKKDRH